MEINQYSQPAAKTSGRLFGGLLWAAMLAYGIGSQLLLSDRAAIQNWGMILTCLNSAFVLGMGLILLILLRKQAKFAAWTYFIGRFAEAILLLAELFVYVNTKTGIANPGPGPHYHFAMLSLGLGSIPAFLALSQLQILPKWICLWAQIGYALLALGALLPLLDFEGAEIWLAIPGGLLELFLGIWLLIKGFQVPTVPTAA